MQLFPLKCAPCLAAIVWLRWRVLQMVILTFLVSVVIAVMEERILKGPYSSISTDIPTKF